MENSSEAADTYTSEDSDAKKLSASLHIVIQCSDLFTKLSSSDFSKADEKAAGSLSTTIDNSIKQYNKDSKSTVPSIGKYVASEVNAVGEIYLHKRQTVELKWHVNKAEPMVDKLTQDMSSYLSDFKELFFRTRNAIWAKRCAFDKTKSSSSTVSSRTD
jgi:hypothetical protein